jgi:hypothetical protein
MVRVFADGAGAAMRSYACVPVPRVESTRSIVPPRPLKANENPSGLGHREISSCDVGTRGEGRWSLHGDPSLIAAQRDRQRDAERVAAIRPDVRLQGASIDRDGRRLCRRRQGRELRGQQVSRAPALFVRFARARRCIDVRRWSAHSMPARVFASAASPFSTAGRQRSGRTLRSLVEQQTRDIRVLVAQRQVDSHAIL